MRRSDAGFSLIEVVVALSILTGGMVLVHQIQGRAARIESSAQDRAAALIIAESVLAETAATVVLSQRRDSGTRGGSDWERSVTAHGEPVQGRRLWRVEVIVRPNSGGRPVHLTTLRSRPVAP